MNNPMVSSTGFKKWYNKKGQLHRTDGPAVTYPDGAEFWFINGEQHRADGPAVICPDGTKYWVKNGQLHRTDGPAIILSNGTKNGTSMEKKYHRFPIIYYYGRRS